MKKARIFQEDIVQKILERLAISKNYNCRANSTINDIEIGDQQENFDIIISDILLEWISSLDFEFQVKEIILHKFLFIITAKSFSTLNPVLEF